MLYALYLVQAVAQCVDAGTPSWERKRGSESKGKCGKQARERMCERAHKSVSVRESEITSVCVCVWEREREGKRGSHNTQMERCKERNPLSHNMWQSGSALWEVMRWMTEVWIFLTNGGLNHHHHLHQQNSFLAGCWKKHHRYSMDTVLRKVVALLPVDLIGRYQEQTMCWCVAWGVFTSKNHTFWVSVCYQPIYRQTFLFFFFVCCRVSSHPNRISPATFWHM